MPFSTPATMKLKRKNHQNSLRLALPENVAYFLKNRAIACPNVAP